MDAAAVQKFIQDLTKQPEAKKAAGWIVAFTNAEDASADDLQELLSADPALGERILRVSNSVMLGHPGAVEEVHQAILFLGFERIISIAVGMKTMDIFNIRGGGDTRNLWMHSYEVALLASGLARYARVPRAGETFLAGLLHDVGRVIFTGIDRKGYLAVEPSEAMFEKERELFGCTHADAGAWFVEKLGLPADIVQATLYHHRPEEGRGKSAQAAVVALAEGLSRKLSPRKEDDGIWTKGHDAVLEGLSISQESIDTVGEKFEEARAEVETLFPVA